MPKKFKGFLEKLKEENYNKGYNKCGKGFIKGWIKHGGTLEEFSERTGTPLDKIYEILKQNPSHSPK